MVLPIALHIALVQAEPFHPIRRRHLLVSSITNRPVVHLVSPLAPDLSAVAVRRRTPRLSILSHGTQPLMLDSTSSSRRSHANRASKVEGRFVVFMNKHYELSQQSSSVNLRVSPWFASVARPSREDCVSASSFPMNLCSQNVSDLHLWLYILF